MGSEIERIVDRKTIRNRVHYLVVWRGFGEESNTWESRMDLVADGYSNVIRDYENSRKDGEGEDAASTGENKTPSRSPSRGRSPGRGKSPAKSASAKTSTSTTSTSSSTSTTGTGRPRGRPRSNSATRSPSASRGKRSSSKSRDGESVRRRSSKKETKELSTTTNGDSTTTMTTTVVEKTTLTVSDDSSVLRETLTALSERAPVARAAAESPVNGETKSTVVQLAYESVTATTASLESPKKQPRSEAIATEPPALRDLWLKLNEGNWLLGFVSVVVVAGSLLASQLLPPSERTPVEISPALGSLEAAARVGQWRQWLPFLTPLVALLLVFHQRDRRAFVKWIAIALAWRIAAELSIFFEFVEVATGAAGVAYTALLVVLVLIARSDDLRSKSTLAAFVVGALLLALSDSWIAQTNNVALPSRVNLMSGSVLLVALSPRFTATPDED